MTEENEVGRIELFGDEQFMTLSGCAAKARDRDIAGTAGRGRSPSRSVRGNAEARRPYHPNPAGRTGRYAEDVGGKGQRAGRVINVWR